MYKAEQSTWIVEISVRSNVLSDSNTSNKKLNLIALGGDIGVGSEEKYLLGKANDTAYYFHYEPEQVTVLDMDFLRTLRTKADQYIIYADKCLLEPELMRKYHIVFKKIPRDITRF